MKILVFGGGGREHALIWALRKSSRVSEIVCAPGNGGIAAVARCVPAEMNNLASMLQVVEAEVPDLVIVGPEVPLAEGIVDALVDRGIRVFGPTKKAAQLETSKGFAKDFMQRWEIPTAAYAVCTTKEQVEQILAAEGSGFGASVVVKADGLAAGKGVVMCDSHGEAVSAAAEMFSGGLLGERAESVVIEETLTGPEISFFAICDGRKAVTLATAQDHKRIGEGDTGPNTGGMGAYSTDDLITSEMSAWLLEHVAQRVVDGMAKEGSPFSGVLFCGIMLTPDGPKVLEFNTRFGDPETEAMMLRLETELLDIIEAAVDGRIDQIAVRLRPGASACVIAASGGYPGKIVSGYAIHGLDLVRGEVHVFHAGTAKSEEEIVTAGGRVLGVSAAGNDLREALGRCYAALEVLQFEGMQFRRDIGWRALKDLSRS
ncbi:phosphoribosylamine--glycine ligase [Granulicella tundricola]|uniref:Phosphoribosylamine--glycine ligase n=1 Tax=Granulicella tundricola (strain ATCC BAA-1859 / DSM 23138 / MP5ACTX9) TaxID=1198114 RepID=E8X3D8_GRATM|nr:phosphoribosylamine--glycine ligase [Granulicella tundricola]ADW70439.1 phosphoribosylamine/glycine ligase [Granulicella tundricola MP5ACTX9]